MPLHYENFAQQVPAEKLEMELDAMNNGTEKHLIAIAKELNDWKEVAPQLNIVHRMVQDIMSKYPNEPAERRYVAI